MARPASVNYHLLKPCNMRCRGCFATFHDVVRDGLPKGLLPRAETLAVTRTLAAHFQKITFAGGEPTLCPWLPQLISAAKRAGCTTMIVTNGTRLTDDWLAAVAADLDWVTLSIDSVDDATHVELGRAVSGRAIPTERYVEIADAVHRHGMRLKINTVVSALNADQDFAPLIERLGPDRWKVFQMLPVEGQNSGSVEPLLIELERFRAFLARHHGTVDRTVLVPEDNAALTGTYAMVDPKGRFFDNTAGHHTYSRPILDVGLEAAWMDVQFDIARFIERGGLYDWAR